MTTLFDAPTEPRQPYWMDHGQDLDTPRIQPLDYLTYLDTSICPYCCEDVGSVFCGHDIHIDEKDKT